jgi:hypothetical protein
MELPTPVKLRYIRYQNIKTPMPHLSISDIRIFGKGSAKPPKQVKNLEVIRQEDRRDALIRWQSGKDCTGYNVLWGIAPDKLYSSWLLYGESDLELKSLNTDQEYYFAIEAFNENGVSQRSAIVTVK